MPEEGILAALEAEGLLARDGARLRPTRRWQAAVARAARRLALEGAPWDLRLPVAMALVELEPGLDDEELARRVEALLPVVAAETPEPSSPRGEEGAGR